MKSYGYFKNGIMMICLLLLSCSNNKVHTSTIQDSDSVLTEPSNSSSNNEFDDSQTLALPREEFLKFPDHLKPEREAAIKISEHIVLDEDRYILDISKDDAISKLGLSDSLYQCFVKQINDINKLIQETLNANNPIEVLDIRAIAIAYKNGDYKLGEDNSTYQKTLLPKTDKH